MTTSKSDTRTNETSEGANGANGSNGTGAVHFARTRGEALARRVRALASALPGTMKATLKDEPSRALGAMFALGVGTGIVLGSRILRTAIASAMSVAIVELGRTYLRGEAEREYGGPTARPTAGPTGP